MKTLNCFSHKMEYTLKSANVIEIFPQVGEIWALHQNQDSKPSRLEHDRQRIANEEPEFGLAVIL